MGFSLTEARSRRGRTRQGPPPSNPELVEAWFAYSKTHMQPETAQKYLYDVDAFVAWVGDHPLATLVREDFWLYIEDYLEAPRSCKFYQSHRFGEIGPRCQLGLDLAACGAACPSRELVRPGTIKKHLKHIESLYKFISRRGYVQMPIIKDVIEEWWEENRHGERDVTYRRINTEELERLIRFTRQPNRRIAWCVLGLTGVRSSELLRLLADPEHLNLDEGWIIVPFVRRQKRRGEAKLWLTEELVMALRAYMEWWERTVKRDADGNPVTNCLLLTARGKPWLTYNALRRAWKEQCIRAGILTGDEDERHTLNLHDTRHWMTTELRNVRTPDYHVALYRGDKRGVVADDYTHFTDDQKRRDFLHYAPRLNL